MLSGHLIPGEVENEKDPGEPGMSIGFLIANPGLARVRSQVDGPSGWQVLALFTEPRLQEFPFISLQQPLPSVSSISRALWPTFSTLPSPWSLR